MATGHDQTDPDPQIWIIEPKLGQSWIKIAQIKIRNFKRLVVD